MKSRESSGGPRLQNSSSLAFELSRLSRREKIKSLDQIDLSSCLVRLNSCALSCLTANRSQKERAISSIVPYTLISTFNPFPVLGCGIFTSTSAPDA